MEHTCGEILSFSSTDTSSSVEILEAHLLLLPLAVNKWMVFLESTSITLHKRHSVVHVVAIATLRYVRELRIVSPPVPMFGTHVWTSLKNISLQYSQQLHR